MSAINSFSVTEVLSADRAVREAYSLRSAGRFAETKLDSSALEVSLET